MEVEALAATDVAELEFTILADGAVRGEVADEVVAALVEQLDLEPPYALRAVRQGRTEWAVAGRALKSEPIVLALPAPIAALEVVVAPNGDRSVLVDGEEATSVDPAWEAAVQELERLGRERFQSFVAHADRVEEGRWELTVDPL